MSLCLPLTIITLLATSTIVHARWSCFVLSPFRVRESDKLFTFNALAFYCPFEFLSFFQAGFIVDDIVLVPRPTILPAGTGMRGWLSMFTRAFWSALPKEPSNNGEISISSFLQ